LNQSENAVDDSSELIISYNVNKIVDNNVGILPFGQDDDVASFHIMIPKAFHSEF
jgi:hypothetical protein